MSAPAAEPEAAPAEAKSEPAPASKEATRATPPAESAPSSPERAESSGEDFTGYATPLVRKLAADNNVDLSSVKGTGVGGRIRKQDILAAAEEAKKAAEAPAPAAAPAASAPSAPSAPKLEPSTLRGTTEKMSRLRKTIAKRMVESLQVSAQLTATVEVDLTAISRIRARFKDDFKAREGASLSYLPFITKATVEALKVFPKVNATIDTEAGDISYPSAEHVGIAVDTERGLLVPVIKDPRLGEVIAVRDMMYLSVSYDHRLVDGADAARFLSHVKARLEEGDFGSEFGL